VGTPLLPNFRIRHAIDEESAASFDAALPKLDFMEAKET
jgi:hypothetical protein